MVNYANLRDAANTVKSVKRKPTTKNFLLRMVCKYPLKFTNRWAVRIAEEAAFQAVLEFLKALFATKLFRRQLQQMRQNLSYADYRSNHQNNVYIKGAAPVELRTTSTPINANDSKIGISHHFLFSKMN